MALIQPHRDPTGVRHPAAYWRIDEIDLDFRDRRAQVRVSCFHDAEAAKNGFAAVDQQWFYPDGDDFDPAIHEALLANTNPGIDHPVVARILQPGYRRGDRIIRAAKVMVDNPE